MQLCSAWQELANKDCFQQDRELQAHILHWLYNCKEPPDFFLSSSPYGTPASDFKQQPTEWLRMCKTVDIIFYGVCINYINLFLMHYK